MLSLNFLYSNQPKKEKWTKNYKNLLAGENFHKQKE